MAALDAVKQSEEKERARQEKEDQNILDKVFANYLEANQQKKSLRDEISYYRNWIGPAISGKRHDEIILLDLERFRKRMFDTGKSPRSMRYVEYIICQVYHYTIDHKIYFGAVPTVHYLRKIRLDNKRQCTFHPKKHDHCSKRYASILKKHVSFSTAFR